MEKRPSKEFRCAYCKTTLCQNYHKASGGCLLLGITKEVSSDIKGETTISEQLKGVSSGVRIHTIIKNEGLGEKITAFLINLRSDLADKGYSLEDAEKSIAGAMPYCIFQHLLSLDK